MKRGLPLFSPDGVEEVTTPDLNHRVETLEREVVVLRAEAASARATNEAHHVENQLRLVTIEKSLTEIAVYLRIGHWVMNTVWACGGAMATAFMIKWLSVK